MSISAKAFGFNQRIYIIFTSLDTDTVYLVRGNETVIRSINNGSSSEQRYYYWGNDCELTSSIPDSLDIDYAKWMPYKKTVETFYGTTDPDNAKFITADGKETYSRQLWRSKGYEKEQKAIDKLPELHGRPIA